MSAPFSDSTFDEDLHLLMALAVLCGQHRTIAPVQPIYETWGLAYPEDSLGPVGRGLCLVGEGQFEQGYNMIRDAAQNARTRADQAVDVLKSLEDSFAQMEASAQ